jgi:hypothetical protein
MAAGSIVDETRAPRMASPRDGKDFRKLYVETKPQWWRTV